MVWKDEICPGKFTPIVPAELFKKVQAMLKVRSKPRRSRKGHQFPFCGIFRCSCGSMITAQWAKGHGGLYRYYRCTRKNGACDEPYLREESVAEQCLTLLRPLEISTEEASEVRSNIDSEVESENQTLGKVIQKTAAMIDPIEEKLAKLTRKFIDDLVTEESFRACKEELILEKARLRQEKQRLQKSRTNYWIEPSREVISGLETLGKRETPTSLPELARLVHKIGTNPLISRKKVTFSFSEDYDFLPSLLVSARVGQTETVSAQSAATGRSTKWCA